MHISYWIQAFFTALKILPPPPHLPKSQNGFYVAIVPSAGYREEQLKPGREGMPQLRGLLCALPDKAHNAHTSPIFSPFMLSRILS